MAEASKETVYIDVDDEITSIVDKVSASDNKIVALVLPKRAATLQSIVNMKLLKRTADQAGKKVVLITSEAGLLPLAGAVGLHVAKTLQSKPAIPSPPKVDKEKEIVAEDTGEDEDVDKAKSVGELAGMSAVAAAAHDADEDTIDVDNIDDTPAPKKKSKAGKSGKLKVPNFDKFRMRMLIIAGAAVFLVIFLFFAIKVLPKAKITIKTNSVAINVNMSFTANTDQAEIDVSKALVPATAEDTKTTSSQKVTTTGKKNVGDKAQGAVSMTTSTNCVTPVSNVPAGSSITNGVVSFTTNDTASFSPTGVQGGKCIWTSGSVGVTAKDGGSKYNVAAGTQFSVSGYNASATNPAAMTGGTDKTISVVSQADINSAKQKGSQDNDKAKADLSSKLHDQNLYPLVPTLQAGKQTTTSSADVGEEADEVTVTVETSYTMLGVKQSDLEKLINNSAKDQIDASKQEISDYGLDNPNITINTAKSPTNQSMSLQTEATSGASIDEVALKKDVAGKKSGDVKTMVSQMPNVEDVTVSYSPFWVTKAPKNPNKITIIVEKQQASNDDNNSQ